MPSIYDLSEQSAVESALDEFDRLGREPFLEKYGFGRARRYMVVRNEKLYDSKAIAGAAFGYQYPEQGPLTSKDFSGGEGAAKPILERLGFEVARLDPPNEENAANQSGGDELGGLFQEALDELAARTPGAGQTFEAAANLKQLIEVDIPARLQAHLRTAREARGSIGMGMVADVPWVALFSRDGANSAKQGYYLVYLFATDGSRVYLSLNQGTENLHGGTAAMLKRALDLRDVAGEQEGLLTEIDLASTNQRPKRYEAGNAFAFCYENGSVPRDDELLSNLDRLIAIISQVEASGLKFDPELEPLHLLFKWNTSREPNTISRHKQVADEQGSVWWGRFGTVASPGMGAGHLADLRHQLEDEVPTYAFLYRRGEIWRTKLLEISNDASAVDVGRLPTYYRADECNLFARLSDFVQLPGDWADGHLVPAGNGDPVKLAGSLSNQTTPLFVYERFDPGAPEVPVSPPRHPEVTSPAPEPPPLTIDWLRDLTGLSEERLEELIRSLQDASPQIILAGPPGTGKTWIAMCLARYLTDDRSLAHELVQFHPSYGYEEFVEGLRPVVEHGGVQFKRVDGVIKKMAEEIAKSGEPRVLVIDEMNRANLPRVFGELMLLLEYRDEPIDLMYSSDFSLPPNLMIIGTMNTADRSIRSLDVALRRRFDVFECPPDASILEWYFKTHINEIPGLIEGFEQLNADLAEQLDRHHLVGHSFFMENPFNAQVLRRVWERQIFPLLEEYFFDQPDLASGFSLEKYWPQA